MQIRPVSSVGRVRRANRLESAAHKGEPMLQSGDRAPLFSLPDADMEMFELGEALRAKAAQYRLEVRAVACLSGCLEPANLGLRGAGRSTLRFSAVSVADVDAFLACARDYWAAPLAADVRKLIPRRLRRKAQVIGPVRA